MKTRTTSLLVLAWLLSSQALAADAAAGKSKAVSCIGCHGMNGISANPLWPNLAGQQEAYLVKQMQAFKSGERKDVNMNALMTPLSESDMADIAAYFASQSCK
jgi:cytochrome c553